MVAGVLQQPLSSGSYLMLLDYSVWHGTKRGVGRARVATALVVVTD
jgi:hypothetical protein